MLMRMAILRRVLYQSPVRRLGNRRIPMPAQLRIRDERKKDGENPRCKPARVRRALSEIALTRNREVQRVL